MNKCLNLPIFRLSFWRLLSSVIFALPVIAGCSKVGFGTPEDSPLALQALCGTLSGQPEGGPRVTSPTADQPVQQLITLRGTCEGNVNVEVSGGGMVLPIQTACVNGEFEQVIRLKDGEGLKDISVAQSGVEGIGRRCVMMDTVAPRVQITPPAKEADNTNNLEVRGVCENGLEVEIIQTGSTGSVTTTCQNGQFTAQFPTVGDGGKDLVATQKDPAGNSGRDDQRYVVDTVAPVVDILLPVSGTLVRDSVVVSGTCEAGLSVSLSGTALTLPVVTLCPNGQFSASVNMAAVDGIMYITAEQFDLAGNRGWDLHNVNRDVTAPIITIQSPVAGFTAQTGVTLAGTCTDGLPVQLSGAGMAAPASTTCSNGGFSASVLFSAGDGAKMMTASQTDAAGNIGSDSRTFNRDNTAPQILVTGPAAGFVTRGTLALVGTCETGLTVQIGGAVTATAPCVAGAFSANLNLPAPDGTKNITASQTDAAGNSATSNRNFVLDTSAPLITITGPAPNTVAQSGVTLTGTCTTGLPVAISGAGVSASSSVNCTNGAFSSNVTFSSGEGVKNIIASQTDAAGNTGSDNRNFIKDTTAPVITITGPAANTVAQNGVTLVGTCTDGLSVNLSGAGLNQNSTTECVSGQFSSMITFSNGDGVKNIIASQADAAGNIGSDNRNFVKDTTGPAIAILNPAAGTTAQTGLTVSGSCTDGLQVDLAGAGLAQSVITTCSNSTFSAAIQFSAGEGDKVVTASQTDSAGNIGSDSRTFVRDNTGPAVAITAPAPNTVAQSGVTLTGTCSTGLPVAISGAGVSANSSVNCTNGSFSSNVTFSSGDGVKNIIASQTDAAGNTGSDNRNFIKDTTAPVITITGPAANTVAQNGVTLVGTCTDGLSVNLSGAGLNQASTTTCVSGQFSAAITFSNGDGVKNLIASQTDAAGNTGSDNRDFVKDSTPPTLTIASPAANTVTQRDLQLAGTCTNGLAINLSGDIAPSMAVCVNGQWSTLISLISPDGTKNIVAAQTDLAGNTATANRNFVLDTTAPVIQIVAPAAGTVTRSALALSGTCTAGLNIQISGAVAAPTSTTCVAGSFTVNLTFTAGDGTKSVTVSQTDAAGNTGADSRSFVLDTTAPLVAFTSPAAGTIAQNGLNINGTCESGLPVNLAGAGLAAPGPVSCSNGQFSANITFSSGDGVKTITASQTDAAGNTGTATRDFMKDTTAPTILITAPAVNTVTRNSLTVSGTCVSGLNVTMSGDIAAVAPVACANGQFSVAVQLSGADGAKIVVASQTDSAGNIGSNSRTFIKDTTAPNIRITSPSNGSKIDQNFSVTGTCEAGLAVNLTGDITPVTLTCAAGGTFTAALVATAGNGARRVNAAQTDMVGNQGTDRVNLVIDPKPSAIENFVADASEGKVDILFIDDNSASMDPEQSALGQKFPSFIAQMRGLDWQIGITTTDCSTGPWGICGTLLPMVGAGTNVLTELIPGYDQVFRNTIVRPETVDCVARGVCPGGLEEGLKATINAINKRGTDNVGMFRDDAALAVVVLTDEDEASTGGPTATRPQAVIDHVRTVWGNDKKFKSYAITILTGDAQCLKTQQDQQAGIGAYGTIPMELARLTGGQSVSICAPDYSVTLQQIGQDLRKLTSAVKLSRVPIASSVSVTFTPAQNVTWTVSGDSVLFNTPVDAGTQIQVYYEYE